jgi:DNA-binding MarR family transcriptional regulator
MKYHGGTAGRLDTEKLQLSPVQQNICLACYKKSKNIDNLAEALSLPKTLLEPELQILIDKELLTKRHKQYYTNFPIETTELQEKIYRLFFDYKPILADKIIDKLIARQKDIKKIGFHGSDKPIDKLLWSLIHLFIRNTFKLEDIFAKLEYPQRVDGKRYITFGHEFQNMTDTEFSDKIDQWNFKESFLISQNTDDEQKLIVDYQLLVTYKSFAHEIYRADGLTLWIYLVKWF